MFDRTWGHLLYASRPVLEHFERLRDQYYEVTHRNGQVWIKHKYVLRHTTKKILSDKQSKECFQKFTQLDDAAVVQVYNKWVTV